MGDESILGQYTIAFKDDTIQEIRVTEVSERLPNKRSVGFEYVQSEPALPYSSRMDHIILSQVTYTPDGKPLCFVEYSSDFSSDAKSDAVADSKYKKQDFLTSLAKFTEENCK